MAIDNEQNKAAVRSLIDAINDHDWRALDALLLPHFVRHQAGLRRPITGIAAFKAFLAAEAQTFPDAQEEIRVLVAEGDRVAAHLSFRGTQRGPLGSLPASGRKLEADFACIFRLEGRKIAEVWVVWDSLDMLQQLGHFPVGTKT